MSLETCGWFKDLAGEFEQEATQRGKQERQEMFGVRFCVLKLGFKMTRETPKFIEQRIRDLLRLFSHPPTLSRLGFHLSAAAPVHLTRLSTPLCSCSPCCRCDAATLCAGALSKPGQTDSPG